jgi:hypothetical protein
MGLTRFRTPRLYDDEANGAIIILIEEGRHMSEFDLTVESRATEHGWSGADKSTREGLIAGVVAATVVGVCLVVIDLLAGQPFNTALAWWSSVVSLFDLGPWALIPVVGIIGYTVMHYAVFIALGKAAAVIVELGRGDPAFRFAAILVFGLAQLMYLSFVVVIHDLALGSVTTCVQLVMGSILGSALITASLLHDRIHPHPFAALRRLRRPSSRPMHDQLTMDSEH